MHIIIISTSCYTLQERVSLLVNILHFDIHNSFNNFIDSVSLGFYQEMFFVMYVLFTICILALILLKAENFLCYCLLINILVSLFNIFVHIWPFLCIFLNCKFWNINIFIIFVEIMINYSSYYYSLKKKSSLNIGISLNQIASW